MATILAFAAVISLVSLNAGTTNNMVTAQEEADFKIKDFGIKDGTPWLTVEGKAGGSTPQNTSLIYAYAFVTENGTFAATSHGGEDSAEVGNDTQWHTHQVTLDENKCVASINDNGKNELSIDKITITDTNVTNVNKVMTAELTKNNDGSICVSKVFDSAP